MEETNMPIVAKKIWNTVRVMFYMLRKGIISKRKLMGDLNLMMTRGKIASKAFHDLVFPFRHGAPHSLNRHVSASPREYEFSCRSNSPAFFKRNKNNRHSHFFACAHAPSVDDDMASANDTWDADVVASPAFWVGDGVVAASPALPGFGRTPARVRRVRITDSPFPLRDIDEDCHVDEAAEEFISRFYKELRRQN